MEQSNCPRCGEPHELIRCPYVKALELEHPGDLASIRRIEFLTPRDCAPPAREADSPAGDYPRKGPRNGT